MTLQKLEASIRATVDVICMDGIQKVLFCIFIILGLLIVRSCDVQKARYKYWETLPPVSTDITREEVK